MGQVLDIFPTISQANIERFPIRKRNGILPFNKGTQYNAKLSTRLPCMASCNMSTLKNVAFF